MPHLTDIDFSALKKYDTQGPRYTSYPTALSFSEDFFNDDLIKAVKTSPNNDLSLYLHIPFCHSLCYYCGCNKVVSRHQSKAEPYLTALFKEISARSALFADYQVKQIHLGGGTPSFLSESQIATLMLKINQQFNVAEDAQIGIEIDPRRLPLDYIDHLANIGFNRLSIGVQDMDTQVQRAINRVQSTPFIRSLVQRANHVGFRSVNLDLIYGLPHQTPERFALTLQTVTEISPQRISLFNYAHLPERFAAQRKIRQAWLPDAETKLALMKLAIEHFCQAGYQMIGMDHFAKPDDELAQASIHKQLHRNFQGYTTHADCDLLGLGVSAISSIGESISQNNKELARYCANVLAEGHGVEKGVILNFDDQVRNYVIRELMCNLKLDKRRFAQLFDTDFDDYFATSVAKLHPYICEQLVSNDTTELVVAPQARLLVRTICMCFDAYLPNPQLQRYSRVI